VPWPADAPLRVVQRTGNPDGGFLQPHRVVTAVGGAVSAESKAVDHTDASADRADVRWRRAVTVSVTPGSKQACKGKATLCS
jgi:hypothetical protein